MNEGSVPLLQNNYMNRKIILSLLNVSFIYSACSAEPGLKVGEEAPDNDSATAQAGNNSDGFSSGGTEEAFPGSAGINTSRESLTVDIADIRGLVIEIATVGCPGDCYDVKAVAKGGNPPYSYKWEDGSTAPDRRLCPHKTGVFSVTASDAEITVQEFRYESQTARAEIRAEVLDCSDGGVLEGGVLDSGGFKDSRVSDDIPAADDGSVAGPCVDLVFSIPDEAFIDACSNEMSSLGVLLNPVAYSLKAGGAYMFSLSTNFVFVLGGPLRYELVGANPSDCQVDSLAVVDVPVGPYDATRCIQPTKDYSIVGLRFINPSTDPIIGLLTMYWETTLCSDCEE